MLRDLSLFVLGAIASTFIQVVVLSSSGRAVEQLAQTRIGRRIRRNLAARKHVHIPQAKDGITIGRLTFPWVVAALGPFSHEEIKSAFDPAEPKYPAEVEALRAEVEADHQRRASAGERVSHDDPGWKLVRFKQPAFDVDRRTLSLFFAPTSRYLMLATELQLDREVEADGESTTLRRRYVAGHDLAVQPIPEVATFWGIGLVVVTSDGRLVLARRSAANAESPNTIWPAVGKGGDRTRHANVRGAPDHLRIAQDGAAEELGVELSADQVRWLALGASANECAYGLIGRASLPITTPDLRKRRSAGAAPRAIENKDLIDVLFDPQSVVELLNAKTHPVSPFALATVVHSLMDEFGLDEVDRAFAQADFAVSGPQLHVPLAKS